jgi:hypothetical protein
MTSLDPWHVLNTQDVWAQHFSSLPPPFLSHVTMRRVAWQLIPRHNCQLMTPSCPPHLQNPSGNWWMPQCGCVGLFPHWCVRKLRAGRRNNTKLVFLPQLGSSSLPNHESWSNRTESGSNITHLRPDPLRTHSHSRP